MRYLIGFLAVGFFVAGMIFALGRNEFFLFLGMVMFFVCLTLCVLDAFIASSRGVKGNHTFNWAVPSRFARKLK